MSMARDRSRESIRREGQSNIPSPLATEFIPHRASDTAILEKNRRFAHGGDWTLYSSDDQEDEQPFTTAHRIPVSYQGYASIDQPAYPVPFNDSRPSHQPLYPGPSPAPLPLETNVTITSKRPRSQDYTSPPTAIHHPSLPNNYYLPPTAPQYPPQPQYYSLPPSHRTSPTAPVFPTGYTSQPMSRDHSHHSHASIAETEPPPHLSPPSPLPYTYHPSNTDPSRYISSFSTSPHRGRERGYDGRPVRKSPKTEYTPYYYNYNNNDTSSPLPPFAPNDPASATSMSRSSSGPGIALPLSAGDEGLGIVGFGASEDERREVQFGGMQPVNFRDAGRRRREAEMRLQQEEGGPTQRKTRPPAPYPDVNMIPSASDPGGLGRMVGEDEGGR